MTNFEKALESAANERVKRSLDALRKYHGPSLEPFDRAIDDAFRAGSKWSRQFTIAEICEWLKTNFETTDKSAANWYAQKIEKHFKDRGRE